MLAAFAASITSRQQIFSFRLIFSFKWMKFTKNLIRFVPESEKKIGEWSDFRQGDEFTCVDHFPLPLAML